MIFVHLLARWYSSQRFCVIWNSAYSESFSTTNGVRQGSILSPFLFAIYMNELSLSLNRYGVEDTRLEAKAKDTKKIRGQGQGQPFRGQTLSRPRTGMLEAKAKPKDTSASALQQKKNVFTKIFQAISKKKSLHKNFSSDLHKKTFSKNFFKRSTKF